APPIRDQKNNVQLKEALVDGTLNLIATDHSPAPPTIKEIESGNILKAWGGIAGLQFLLSASWTSLQNVMSLEKFIPLLTEQPARFLKIDTEKGFLKEGFDADFTIWLPEEKFTVKKEDIRHKHQISPYIGEELYGTVQQTYINGELVFSNNKILKKNCGKWLLRK
ncbi:MAG TPA: amidohydrolase family protein, partial [Chitinophagaceae bacterium]|nr:amidohydrolase family protein [Chitinophagaceae bacterium]